MPISAAAPIDTARTGLHVVARSVWVTVVALLAARLLLVAMASFWDAPLPEPVLADIAPGPPEAVAELHIEAQVIAAAHQARDAAIRQAVAQMDAAFARAREAIPAYRAVHYGVAGHYAELRSAAALALGWTSDPPLQARIFGPLSADLSRAAAEADRAMTDQYLTRATLLVPEVGVNDARDLPPLPADPPLAAQGRAFADFGWHAGPAFRTAAGALLIWVALAWVLRRQVPPFRARMPVRVLAGIGAGIACWAAADQAFLAADNLRFGAAFEADLADLVARQQAEATAVLIAGLSAKADLLAATTIRDMRDENG
ncbi:MAG TPA: hypothetical protein VLA78_14465 [Paracoccaceae bacterium]|nr:hypothetical protein [Paracoccaceae bacterium]